MNFIKNNRLAISMAIVGVIAGIIFALNAGLFLDKSPDTRGEQLKKLDQLRITSVRQISERNYSRAVKLLLQISFLNSYDEFPYRQLARVALELGVQRFEKIFIESIAGLPNSNREDMIMGAVYSIIGELKLASSSIDAFLDQHGQDTPALFYKGAIALRKGDHKRAITILTEVTQLQPTYYFAYLELQKAYEASGDTAKADKMLQLAMENNPALNKNAICHGVDGEDPKKDKFVKDILGGK